MHLNSVLYFPLSYRKMFLQNFVMCSLLQCVIFASGTSIWIFLCDKIEVYLGFFVPPVAQDPQF